MPFDPNIPQENTLIDAAQMRAQLTGLLDLINAIVTITAAQVDGVTTEPAGTPANVTVTVSGGTLHFSFEIPQGQDGPMGPPGPPFASAVVDAVSTLDPGEPATVEVRFDGTDVHFAFGIPRGADGPPGPEGPQGPPGADGEVTTAAMTAAIDTAIADTAQNPSGIAPYGGGFSDPPTQAEMEAFASWAESLRAALLR